MRVSEFKAVSKKTNLFAISPTSIQDEIPGSHTPERNKRVLRWCPLGLVKARVIEIGVEWTSIERFGCTAGSSKHEVTHGNGIKVQFDAPTVDSDFSFDYDKAAKNRHVELVPDPKDPGLVKHVRMIVSAKALIMPWSDYKPVQDRRRKIQREGERRQERMARAITVVGGRYGQWHDYRKKGEDESTYDARLATVEMPMVVAEGLGEVLALLDADPMDDAALAVALQRWREDAEQFDEAIRSKVER